MGLLQLKTHLQSVKQASLLELCQQTGRDPDVLRDMLQHWVRKGVVQCTTKTDACGKTCSQCDPLFVEHYVISS